MGEFNKNRKPTYPKSSTADKKQIKLKKYKNEKEKETSESLHGSKVAKAQRKMKMRSHDPTIDEDEDSIRRYREERSSTKRKEDVRTPGRTDGRPTNQKNGTNE